MTFSLQEDCTKQQHTYINPSQDDLPGNYVSTNALVATDLPIDFFERFTLENIRNEFEKFGLVQSFSPIKGLRRIIIVFDDSANELPFGTAVTQAKFTLHNQKFNNFILKLYALEPIYLTPDEEKHLKVAPSTKLWLISPPASPPGDWKESLEDPPNRETFSNDLISALNHLTIESSILNSNNSKEIKQFILESSNHFPSICVEDFGHGLSTDGPALIPRTPLPF